MCIPIPPLFFASPRRWILDPCIGCAPVILHFLDIPLLYKMGLGDFYYPNPDQGQQCLFLRFIHMPFFIIYTVYSIACWSSRIVRIPWLPICKRMANCSVPRTDFSPNTCNSTISKESVITRLRSISAFLSSS